MKAITLLLLTSISLATFAENRAKVADMSANLKLPNGGGTLHVPTVFDNCAGGHTNVSGLIFSKELVEYIAALEDRVYGNNAGDSTRAKWNTQKENYGLGHQI